MSRFFYCYAECHYAECRNAECRNAECRNAECRYAYWHYAICRYAECDYAESHYAECHFAECHGAALLFGLSRKRIKMIQIILDVCKRPTRGQGSKTFYGRNLRMGLIS